MQIKKYKKKKNLVKNIACTPMLNPPWIVYGNDETRETIFFLESIVSF